MRRRKSGIINRPLAIRELLRRKRERSNLPKLLDGIFKAQEDFINDPRRLKAALCTRRAGKSYGCALYLIKEALENAGSNNLYIALTRDSAKKIAWKDCLKVINRKYRLNMRFNEASLTATLPNGSQISLTGVDVSEKEMQKLLGQKYKLVIIDESASFTIDLRELVYVILKPAIADLMGTICLIGTPGNITKSLFFDICEGKEPGWSLHKWTANDNPYMRDAWAIELEDIERERPEYMQTAQFKQHYLGLWVIDDTKLVYKYDRAINQYHDLPKYEQGDWVYNMGVDLGYNDHTAFVIVAYHEHDKTLYVVNTYKAQNMDITDVANRIKRYQRDFDLTRIVVDGANKQAVMEIQNRHGIHLVAADKTGKEDFINILNDELIQGHIKLHDINGRHLREEWDALIWDDKGSKRVEHAACANHLSDAALYIWRHCYQYYSQRPPEPPKPYSQEWYDQEEKAIWESTLSKVRREHSIYGDELDILY